MKRNGWFGWLLGRRRTDTSRVLHSDTDDLLLKIQKQLRRQGLVLEQQSGSLERIEASVQRQAAGGNKASPVSHDAVRDAIAILDDLDIVAKDPSLGSLTRDVIERMRERMETTFALERLAKVGHRVGGVHINVAATTPVAREREGEIVEVLSQGYRLTTGELLRKATVVAGSIDNKNARPPSHESETQP